MNVHARSVSRPACVRRNSARNACDVLGRGRDEPEHQVGVGAEPDRRVRAADLHAPVQRLVEVLDLLHDVGQGSSAERSRGTRRARGTPDTGRRSCRSCRSSSRLLFDRRAVEVRRAPARPSPRRRGRSRGPRRRRTRCRRRRYPRAATAGSPRRDRRGRARTAASPASTNDGRRVGPLGEIEHRGEMPHAGVDELVVARLEHVLVAGAAHVTADHRARPERRVGPLAVIHVHAVIGALPRGTTKPVPSGRAPACPRR